jgi:hypothetical protein
MNSLALLVAVLITAYISAIECGIYGAETDEGVPSSGVFHDKPEKEIDVRYPRTGAIDTTGGIGVVGNVRYSEEECEDTTTLRLLMGKTSQTIQGPTANGAHVKSGTWAIKDGAEIEVNDEDGVNAEKRADEYLSELIRRGFTNLRGGWSPVQCSTGGCPVPEGCPAVPRDGRTVRVRDQDEEMDRVLREALQIAYSRAKFGLGLVGLVVVTFVCYLCLIKLFKWTWRMRSRIWNAMKAKETELCDGNQCLMCKFHNAISKFKDRLYEVVMDAVSPDNDGTD